MQPAEKICDQTRQLLKVEWTNFIAHAMFQIGFAIFRHEKNSKVLYPIALYTGCLSYQATWIQCHGKPDFA